MKTLYIISGCNGAGKTTASKTILPEALHCREFVNADEIAKGISPFNPSSANIAAGKIMFQRIETLLKGENSFSIETTLAGKSNLQLVHRAKQHGFQVQLLFFWLETPEAAILRVAQRVKEGGHDVPEAIIQRRYLAGIQNFFYFFKDIVDAWTLIDNETNPHVLIAQGGSNMSEQILNSVLYNKFLYYVRRTN